MIGVDIGGPSKIVGIHENQYYYTIMGQSTWYTWIFLMNTKPISRIHLRAFDDFIDTQFNTKIRIISTVNGSEFGMNNFCNSKGIIHQTMCKKTPTKCGCRKKKHQHILNVTRHLIFSPISSKVCGFMF